MRASVTARVPLLVVSLAACGGSPAVDVCSPAARFPDGIEYGPQVALPTPTSILVAWRTTAAGAGAVEYWTAATTPVRVDGAGAGRDQAVPLEGLVSGAAYSYRVLVDGVPVPGEHSFRTPPSDPAAAIRFAVVGDSGSGCPPQFQIADRLVLEDPDFILHTGDIAYNFGTADEMRLRYFVPFAEPVARVPVFAVLGNHDHFTRGGEDVLQALQLPVNDEDGTEHFYSFDRGGCHFAGVDTELSLDPGGPQLRWLARDLSGTAARWRFLFLHRCPYSSSRNGSQLDVRAAIEPFLGPSAIDLVFAGHDHNYERTLPLRLEAVVDAGREPDY
ncbi:MAG: purple acid phosphatase family protein, partial [Planctomycetota bacterium]